MSTSSRSYAASRPQLVCVVADNGETMRGAKAEAATNAIREMILRCQIIGPRGQGRDYFRLVVIRVGSEAEIVFNMVPARQIDVDDVVITGHGGASDMSAALDITYNGLDCYLSGIVACHPQRDRHPLPLVIVVSDGRSGGGGLITRAKEIKSLVVDGDAVRLVTVVVSDGDSTPADEELLRAIASRDSCLKVSELSRLVDIIKGSEKVAEDAPLMLPQEGIVGKLRDLEQQQPL